MIIRGTFRFDERSGQVVEIPKPQPPATGAPQSQLEPARLEPPKLYTGFYL